MRQRGVNVKAGDTVPYVICQVPHIANGVKTGFAEKAYHPDDVMHGEMQLGKGFTYECNNAGV